MEMVEKSRRQSRNERKGGAKSSLVQIIPYRVYGGSVLTCSKRTEICCTPFKNEKKLQKKLFDQVTASALVTTFWVIHFIRAEIFVLTIWTLWVSKDAIFMLISKIQTYLS
jgi:hypothetical protein